jgi:hypothetical protein
MFTNNEKIQAINEGQMIVIQKTRYIKKRAKQF